MKGFCQNPDCTFNVDGVCARSIQLDECPDLTLDEQVTAEEEPEQSLEVVSLSNGRALTQEQANELARSALTRLIVILGESDSGKTTLLAHINERLQRGPLGEMSFAGSRTLPAFEERCFLSRSASRRSQPTTQRTPLGQDQGLLHLTVVGERRLSGAKRKQEVLFTDIAGERCKAAREDDAALASLSICRRADHLVLLVDALKLSKPESAFVLKRDTRGLLRVLLESRMLAGHSYLDIIFSKWDLIPDGTHKSLISYRELLERDWAPQVRRLRCLCLSTREGPDGEFLGDDFGQIFNAWVSDTPFMEAAEKRSHSLVTDGREMEKFFVE